MKKPFLLLVGRWTASGQASSAPALLPFVINTWGGPFTAATDAAYLTLVEAGGSAFSALDAVQAGCATCERRRCDGSVGAGGSPDEQCETTADAMMMDGTTLKTGAVAGLRRVRSPIAAARLVLDYTHHSLLAGDLATRFAVDLGGLPEENLTTPRSAAQCAAWRAAACQPNYRAGALVPDPRSACGPYTRAAVAVAPARPPAQAPLAMPSAGADAASPPPPLGRSHDTISMVAIHADGSMAAGTSTNGAAHKIPGRVGDGPIAGSGSYVDGDVGGCGATGDGDVMMRFLPCYQAVESMRQGMTPQHAAENAVMRILKKYPHASTGLVVVNNKGMYGGAASGWTFTYSLRGGTMTDTHVVTVSPLSLSTK